MNFPSLPSSRKRKILLFVLATRNLWIALMVFGLLGSVDFWRVQAAGLPVVTAAGTAQAQTAPHGSNCLLCHGVRNFTGTLGDGVKINLTVDSESVKNNIHLRLGTCAICHKGFDGYPHPNTKGVSCSQCHVDGGISTDVTVPSRIVAMSFCEPRSW